MTATAITPKVEPEAVGLVPANGGAVSDLLRFAIDKGAPIESLERLVALQERIMDRNAAAEFFDAMALFQSKCPPIPKSSTADVTKDGRKIASYNFAELPTIAGIINPILAPLGLSYTWDSKATDGMMVVTCTVRHRSGHSQTATFTSPISGTTLMSDMQKGASALTYAKRQSLVQALGLTTGEVDADGGEGGGEPVAKITEEQGVNLDARLDSAGNKVEFLAFYGIESVYELPAKMLAGALDMQARREKRR